MRDVGGVDRQQDHPLEQHGQAGVLASRPPGGESRGARAAAARTSGAGPDTSEELRPRARDWAISCSLAAARKSSRPPADSGIGTPNAPSCPACWAATETCDPSSPGRRTARASASSEPPTSPAPVPAAAARWTAARCHTAPSPRPSTPGAPAAVRACASTWYAPEVTMAHSKASRTAGHGGSGIAATPGTGPRPASAYQATTGHRRPRPRRA